MENRVYACLWCKELNKEIRKSHIFRSTWRVWTPLPWFCMNIGDIYSLCISSRHHNLKGPSCKFSHIGSRSHFFLFLLANSELKPLNLYLIFLLPICFSRLFLYVVLHIFLIIIIIFWSSGIFRNVPCSLFYRPPETTPTCCRRAKRKIWLPRSD